MPQELVTADEFLTRLGQCFADPSSSGTVWLTHKRYTFETADTDGPVDDADGEPEYDVLVRCTHGDRAKFSARVGPASQTAQLRPADHTSTYPAHYTSFVPFPPLCQLVQIPASRLPEFHTRYGALLKASMAPRMRKRDKKREKARAEALTKKRKELYVDVTIGNEGKRGTGRRQRMRKVAAQRKKEVERERVEAGEMKQV